MDTDVGGRWKLSVTALLSAAHALRHYEGKCERIHGHNFEITAEIEGSKLAPDTGILLDFKELKAMLAKILAPYDHQLLNDVPPFETINPSSENIARLIAKKLEELLAESGSDASLRVGAVTVSEKKGQSATWLPD